MSWWRRAVAMFAPERVRTLAQLADFLESRAAYLVQKSMTEYCHARANMLFSTLLGEPAFRDAYERAKWRSYPAAMAMVAEMAMVALRGQVEPVLLSQNLAGMARRTFMAFPLPDGLAATFWADAATALVDDLAHVALAPPRAVHRIPLARAREIFDALPVHETLRAHDYHMFRNTLRLHLTEIAAEFEARADPIALGSALNRSATDGLHG